MKHMLTLESLQNDNLLDHMFVNKTMNQGFTSLFTLRSQYIVNQKMVMHVFPHPHAIPEHFSKLCIVMGLFVPQRYIINSFIARFKP